MQKIDLLPPAARESKARRKQAVSIFCAQIMVLLIVAAGFFVLLLREQRATENILMLNTSLAAFDPAPAEVAARLDAARSIVAYIEELMYATPPFRQEWLEIVAESVPEGAEIIGMDFRGQSLSLSGTAASIELIEQHRLGLGLYFSYVRSGGIARTDYGYTYELTVLLEESPE